MWCYGYLGVIARNWVSFDVNCKSRLLGSRHICLSGLRKWSKESDEESSSVSLDCGRNIFAFRLSVFAVYMKSKDVWHITTFYGYAWLAILALGEACLLKKN